MDPTEVTYDDDKSINTFYEFPDMGDKTTNQQVTFATPDLQSGVSEMGTRNAISRAPSRRELDWGKYYRDSEHY